MVIAYTNVIIGQNKESVLYELEKESNEAERSPYNNLGGVDPVLSVLISILPIGADVPTLWSRVI